MRKRIGNENLTSFLHEDKQIIKKFLALGVVVQFVKLYRRCKSSLALFLVKTRKGTSSELTDLCKVPGWFCSASSSFVLLSPDGSSLCVRRERREQFGPGPDRLINRLIWDLFKRTIMGQNFKVGLTLFSRYGKKAKEMHHWQNVIIVQLTAISILSNGH